MRPTEANVSPSNGAAQTTVNPSNSTEACGKWRSRLRSSERKSTSAVSSSPASFFTMSPTFDSRASRHDERDGDEHDRHDRNDFQKLFHTMEF